MPTTSRSSTDAVVIPGPSNGLSPRETETVERLIGDYAAALRDMTPGTLAAFAARALAVSAVLSQRPAVQPSAIPSVAATPSHELLSLYHEMLAHAAACRDVTGTCVHCTEARRILMFGEREYGLPSAYRNMDVADRCPMWMEEYRAAFYRRRGTPSVGSPPTDAVRWDSVTMRPVGVELLPEPEVSSTVYRAVAERPPARAR